MLNVFLYGAIASYVFVGVGLVVCGKWIVNAYLLNRRAKQMAERYLGMPLSSDVAPWGRKFGR